MRRIVWSLIGVSILLSSGCALDLPNKYPLAQYKRKQILGSADSEPEKEVVLPAEIENKLAQTLLDYFGSPDEPSVPSASTEQLEKLHAGADLYQRNCIHCHGIAGGADGPTAPFLFPRPRDYRRGIFKWKSTTRNSKPTRADLVRIISEGAIGTSMPPFKLWPAEQIEQMVDYVVFLSKRGELERMILYTYLSEDTMPDAAAIAQLYGDLEAAWKAADESVVEPEQTMPAVAFDSDEFNASVERGKKLFLDQRAACYKCHGSNGQANPSDWAEAERKLMFDDWGNANYPRNLTLGMFRGGRRPVDIYRRIHQGISGAAMPEGGKALKPNEIWDLVNFARALPYRPALLPTAKVAKAEHGH